MKKILFFALLFFAVSKITSAQNEQKYVGAMHKVDSFLNRYLQYSTLAKVGDNQINEYVIEKYKKMFAPDISIVDENCPAYYDGDFRHPYDLKERPITIICNYAKNTFAEGLSVKLLNANIDYSNLISNQVNVVLNKQVKGKTVTGLRIVNNDTIELQITFSTDFEKMQITNTKLIGHTISFLNDIDGDFVRDELDKCKLKRGFKNPDGCPTADEKQDADILAMELKKKEKENKINDQVFETSVKKDKTEAEQAADQARLEKIAQIKDAHEKEIAARKEAKRNAYAALQQQPQWYFGADLFAGSPQIQSYSYADNFSKVYDQSGSFFSTNKKPSIPTITTVGLQANLEYFIRKQAHWGIGISLQYQFTKGEVSKSDFDVTYKAVDYWGNYYKRHVTTSENAHLKETFTMNQFSVPLLLKYKNNFSKKIGFELEAGINLIVSATGDSKLGDNVLFDYESTYHYGNSTAKDYFSVNNQNNNDWVISKTQATRSGNGSAADYFSGLQKENFDVGINEKPSTTNLKFNYKPTMGLIFHPSLTYKDNDNIVLNFGLMIMTQEYDNKNDVSKYSLTNKVGEYNTLMNSMDKIKTNFTAITIGIKYAIQPNSQK